MLRRRFARSEPSVPRPVGDRVLVAGWFSWSGVGTTAGDLLARDVACTWLERAGYPFDVANHTRFGPGVDWRTVDPARYSTLVFVCGPLRPGSPAEALFARFRSSRKVGVDLSMIEPVGSWNPFDVLFERDSERGARPDLAFASASGCIPVIGMILVEEYPPEYPGRDRQRAARRAAAELGARAEAVCIDIDTRLEGNAGGLRTAWEIESLIARTDVTISTRLHGLVLSLKHGVPCVAIDPVSGGAKISRQAEVIGWPIARTADQLDANDLDDALRFCLSDEARDLARQCARRAQAALGVVEVAFAAALDGSRPDAGAL